MSLPPQSRSGQDQCFLLFSETSPHTAEHRETDDQSVHLVTKTLEFCIKVFQSGFSKIQLQTWTVRYDQTLPSGSFHVQTKINNNNNNNTKLYLYGNFKNNAAHF